MSFLNTMDITTSALTAERLRMDVIAQNLANIDNTRAANGEPYRRRLVVFQEKQLTFQSALEREAYKISGARMRTARTGTGNTVNGGVRVEEIIQDPSDFVPVYNPSHPGATAKPAIARPPG